LSYRAVQIIKRGKEGGTLTFGAEAVYEIRVRLPLILGVSVAVDIGRAAAFCVSRKNEIGKMAT